MAVDVLKVIDALDARRKQIRYAGLSRKHGNCGSLSSAQIDDACSLFCAADRLRNSGRRCVGPNWCRDMLADYYRKAEFGDHSAELVVKVVEEFIGERK